MLIMQQPSGFVDKHIMKWHLEKQGERYTCSLCQRDLFTGAYCEESRLAMATINQLSSWVWGKMSACLQLTDTDAAQPFKSFANKAQHELRRELRAKAEREGTHAVFKQGTYEILRVTLEALKKLKVYMDLDQPRTLQALVRKYTLSYWPNP